MTLVSLAEACGLTKGFISQVESGNSGVSLASLERIAAALRVPLSSLMASEGDVPATIMSEGAQEPLLLAARNLYQETTGLAQIAGAKTGRHFLASLPPNTMLSSPLDLHRGTGSEGIVVVLQGSLVVRHSASQLRLSAGEVASWDCMSRYSIENQSAVSARALVFIPDGAPLPAVTRLPDSYSSSGTVAYPAAPQGPMRLVEMRARRHAERRR